MSTLMWQDVSVEISSAGGPRKIILDSCGIAKSGRIAAVLGPSGSGKTTLLHALAGRLEKASKLQLTGSVEPPPSPAKPASFVYQEDAFHSRLTVTETLYFAAALRLPRQAASAAVAEVLVATGLRDVASSTVGGAKVRGISGGERKRLSIACELLSSQNGSPLFADEPTSGLDSFQALRIVEALRRAARDTATGGSGGAAARTVILTVHQPSTRLLALFDDVMLLGAGGRTLFMGPVSQMVPALETCLSGGGGGPGSTLRMTSPPLRDSPPAELALEVASIDPADEEQGKRRVAGLAEAWAVAWRAQRALPAAGAGAEASLREGEPAATGVGGAGRAGASLAVQLGWCSWRAWRQSTASVALLSMRAIGTVVTGLMFGCIFWRLGVADVKGRVGCLQVLCNYAAMTAALKAVRVLQDGEAVVVRRERASGALRLLPYFLGKVLAEMPMSLALPALLVGVTHSLAQLAAPLVNLALLLALETVAAGALGLAAGALSPTLDTGLEGAKAVMTLSTVFGGLYFDASTLPRVLQWVPRTSLVRITWEGALVHEMSALAQLQRRPSSSSSNAAAKIREHAAALLAAQGVDPTQQPGQAMMDLALIALVLYLVAFAALALKAPRFQRLEAKRGNGMEAASSTGTKRGMKAKGE